LRLSRNSAAIMSRSAGGRLPGSVIDHWAFDGEDAPILVDNDQEEWPRGFVHITK
jgi:hypothetical protein